MKSKNLKEKEKRQEKIGIWILTIATIILFISTIYGWLKGDVAPGYDWFPDRWFYER